jgi:VanZ family protein
MPVYAIVLVLLSVLPINSAGSAINHIFIVTLRLDYLLHSLVYIPLTVIVWIDKKIDIQETPLTGLTWLFGLMIFGAVTEWLQYFLPYRAFNINDLLANCLGTVAGFLIVLLYRSRIAGL